MPHATVESSLPMLWELTLPDRIIQAAAERSARKGNDGVAIYEHTEEHAYILTTMAITALLSKYIRLIHTDGKCLHIFLDEKFQQNDLMQLRRVFDTVLYIPDIVLHDILKTDQAVFAMREQEGDEAVEYHYDELLPYAGPVDYSDIREELLAAGVADPTKRALVYEIGQVRETRYEGSYTDMPIEIVGSTRYHVDTWQQAQKMITDRILLKKAITAAERYFKKTKYKAV